VEEFLLSVINIDRVSDVRHIEINRSELLVPDPSPFEAEIAIAKLERYKLQGSDQILAELIQAGGETLWSEIHRLSNSIWNSLLRESSLISGICLLLH
jgi:hypothetical protein